MGRDNIYKNISVASVMPKPMIQDLVDFLAANRNFVLSSEKKNEAFRTRYSGQSFISDIVHRLTVLGKTADFTLVQYPSKLVALREAIDMTFLPIDLLQMKEMIPSSSNTLSILPELRDQLVINITDITKANGDFSDVTQFHNRVVRDFLSRNYYTSSGSSWISPNLVRYVAKVYSMTIGGAIAKSFNLPISVQMFIQTLFCAFFVGKMTSPDITTVFLRNHARYLGLPDTSDVTQIMAFAQDILNKDAPTSLEEVFAVIDAYDNNQLKTATGSRLTRPVLRMKFASWCQDIHTSVIALEYPPYFAYLILQALTNARIGLAYPMKQMNLMTEGKTVFEQLIKSPTFLSAS